MPLRPSPRSPGTAAAAARTPARSAFRTVPRTATGRPDCVRTPGISFHPNRSHNGPRLVPPFCASSAELPELRYAVSSLEEPATSSSLDGPHCVMRLTGLKPREPLAYRLHDVGRGGTLRDGLGLRPPRAGRVRSIARRVAG